MTINRVGEKLIMLLPARFFVFFEGEERLGIDLI